MSDKKEKIKYVNLLSNESAKAQGWKVATLIMTGLVIYMAFLIRTTLSEMPVRLIPYNFQTAQGVVEVTANGVKNQEYIQLVGRGDADLFTEFTPKDSKIRALQLANRFVPGLQGSAKSQLISQANENADNEITQSYRISRIKSRDGNEVLVYGYLKRWEGNKLISEGEIHFAITYEYIDGIPYIYDYTPFKGEKKAIEELNKKKNKKEGF